MRRYSVFFLCLLLACALMGCQENTAPATEPITQPTTAATEGTTEATEPVWTGYAGPKEEYTYYYAEGRNLEWEEDVLFFAESHLSDNQLLRNRQFLVELPGVRTDSANFYDAALHTAFLEGVNALIPEIENLTDNQILYRIQMLSALFRDVHTRVYLDSEAIFPILFMPMNEEGEWVFYAVVLPNKNEKLLYTTLTAINDIPVGEVIQRLRGYMSYENEYGFYNGLAQGGYRRELLSSAAALEAVGIIATGDTWAKYTLVDTDGNATDLNMKATDDFRFSQCCGTTPGMALPVPYWYGDENYWYTTSLEESTLYVRIYSFHEDEEKTYMDLSNTLTVESRNAGRFHKIIVDLRGNGGGYKGVGWRSIISTLGRVDFDEFYILVDGGTYSCSMLFASELKYAIPEAVFVGTPTGEAPGFFAAVYDGDYIMPNCGVEFTIPTQYYQTFDPNEENALIPDIVIWQTIEDYIACRDAVLEYVLTE